MKAMTPKKMPAKGFLPPDPHHTLKETETVMWVLMTILLGLILLFSYWFWQKF